MRQLIKITLISTLILFVQINLGFFKAESPICEIEAYLALPNDQIDVVRAKLMMDKFIDPKINIEHYLKEIERMASEIVRLSGKKEPNNPELITYLYTEGSWNNHQPYTYDFKSSWKLNNSHSSLAKHIDTKQGNCVSMPLLYYALARKFKLEAYLAHAPEHIFIKMRGLDGNLINVEVTNGGHCLPNKYYIDKLSISKEALKNARYLEPVSNRYAATILLSSSLLPFYLNNGDYIKALYVCNIVLKYIPMDIQTIKNKSALYNILFLEQVPYPTNFYAVWLRYQYKRYLMLAKKLGHNEVRINA